ncbi:hypothetical protein ACLB2K_072500 [Fragaria x ananassa]
MNDYMPDMYMSISSLEDGLKFLVNGGSENKSEGYSEALLMSYRCGNLPDYCDQLTDVSVLGNMKKLQILSMREVPVEELPIEIGNLKDLRMLDMSGSENYTAHPGAPRTRSSLPSILKKSKVSVKWTAEMDGCAAHPGALNTLSRRSYNISAFPFKLLSRLHKLEELHMQYNFGEERSKAVVKEEEDYVRSDGEPCWRNLDILELSISNSNCLPKYVEFNPYWVNFDICISRYLPARKSTLDHDTLPYSRVLTLDTTINSLPDWFINVVVPDTEKLEYIQCKGLNNILVEYDHGRFVELKYLAVTRHHENLEALMNTITWVPKQPVFESLEELHLCEVDCLKVLCVGKLPPGFLFNLKLLVVTSCMKLKSLFTWDVAQCLSQFEDLSITRCPSLERVIEASEKTLKIAFPELKNLVLSNLPQLVWFYSTGSAIIECLALEHLHVQDCPQFAASTSDFHSWNQVRSNDLPHLRSNNDEMSNVTSGLNEEFGTSLTPEDTVESLSPNARQHIEILRELQCQRDELEAKFLQERAALEAKFQQVVSTFIQSSAYESA